MRTARQLSVDRAVLAALAAVPAEFLLTTATLHADAARRVTPRATTAELDASIAHLDQSRRIAGIVGEELGQQWQITDAGQLWLARNP